MNELQVPERFKYYILDYLDKLSSFDREELYYTVFTSNNTVSHRINEMTEEQFWLLYQHIVERDLKENAGQFKFQSIREYQNKIHENWKERDKYLDEQFPNGIYTKHKDYEWVGNSLFIKSLFKKYSEAQQTELQKFLKEFYDMLIRASEHAGSSSSFGDTLFVMMNGKESLKDVIERILELPKHKFEWEEEDYLQISEHDTVELLRDLNSEYLKGDKGTVVHIYPERSAYEVEFPNDVLLLDVNDIKKVNE